MSYHLETPVRLILALAGFFGVLFAPWWVPLVCMILLSLRYAAWEVPIIGLCMDLVWLPSGGHFAIPVFTLLGIIIVWSASPLRRQLLL
jgi:hypothetical protein